MVQFGSGLALVRQWSHLGRGCAWAQSPVGHHVKEGNKHIDKMRNKVSTVVSGS